MYNPLAKILCISSFKNTYVNARALEKDLLSSK